MQVPLNLDAVQLHAYFPVATMTDATGAPVYGEGQRFWLILVAQVLVTWTQDEIDGFAKVVEMGELKAFSEDIKLPEDWKLRADGRYETGKGRVCVAKDFTKYAAGTDELEED